MTENYSTTNPLRRIALASNNQKILEKLAERDSARLKHIGGGNSEAQFFRNAGITEIAFESAKRMPEYWRLTEDGKRALSAIVEGDAPHLSNEQADTLYEHSERLQDISGTFKGREITGHSYTGETTCKFKRLGLIEEAGWTQDSLRLYKFTEVAEDALDYLDETQN